MKQNETVYPIRRGLRYAGAVMLLKPINCAQAPVVWAVVARRCWACRVRLVPTKFYGYLNGGYWIFPMGGVGWFYVVRLIARVGLSSNPS